MPSFLTPIEATCAAVESALGEKLLKRKTELGELTVVVSVQDYEVCAKLLKTSADCQFEQLIDLCGVDYSEYEGACWAGSEARYAVVLHLLSVSLNQRMRLVVFCPNDDMPTLPSLTHIWASSNWFEREAFDLFGIVFDGHNDLRRILTDYGFIGHPFRKDFPTSGHVEMRYDEQARRVIYQPVSIEPREITPRIIREEGYGGISRG